MGFFGWLWERFSAKKPYLVSVDPLRYRSKKLVKQLYFKKVACWEKKFKGYYDKRKVKLQIKIKDGNIDPIIKEIESVRGKINQLVAKSKANEEKLITSKHFLGVDLDRLIAIKKKAIKKLHEFYNLDKRLEEIILLEKPYLNLKEARLYLKYLQAIYAAMAKKEKGRLSVAKLEGAEGGLSIAEDEGKLSLFKKK